MIEDGRATLIQDGEVLTVATSATGSRPELGADVERPKQLKEGCARGGACCAVLCCGTDTWRT